MATRAGVYHKYTHQMYTVYTLTPRPIDRPPPREWENNPHVVLFASRAVDSYTQQREINRAEKTREHANSTYRNLSRAQTSLRAMFPIWNHI